MLVKFPNKSGAGPFPPLWWSLGLISTVLVIILPAWQLLKAPIIEVNPYFSLETMERGFHFTREGVLLKAFNDLLIFGLLWALVFSRWGTRFIRKLERAGGSLFLGLVYITLAIAGLEVLISFPFAWYLNFYREKLWGLSVQSWLSWLAEYLLSFTLNCFSSLVLFLLIFWLIKRFRQNWWVFTGFILSALTAFLFMLYPILISPLFNEQKPLQDPQLTAAMEKLAQRAGIELEGVWEEKASIKTQRANAYVTGLGPTKRIVIWDTLIRDYSPQEVEAVVAHELGHVIYNDIFWGWLGSSLLTFVTGYIVSLALKNVRNLGKLQASFPYQPRVLTVVILLFFILAKLSLPLANTSSRWVEYRADRFAVTLSGQGEVYISVMQKLAQSNPIMVDPPPLVEWILFDHPAPLKRIQALEPILTKEGAEIK